MGTQPFGVGTQPLQAGEKEVLVDCLNESRAQWAESDSIKELDVLLDVGGLGLVVSGDCSSWGSGGGCWLELPKASCLSMTCHYCFIVVLHGDCVCIE